MLTRLFSYDIINFVNKHDPLAQSAEHLTFNQGVRSSNLRWITTSLFSSSFKVRFSADRFFPLNSRGKGWAIFILF